MRVITAEVTNFASYKRLAFNFTEAGLTLISGPTGSGKSTLCDVIPWILFGKTAKDGAVDEIRSWNSEEPTRGEATIETSDGQYIVVRIRGSSKDNDLYYHLEDSSVLIRGKDLGDTQKQLNALLGMDADKYLAGAYFHEFSRAAQFFTLTAKNRRLVTEQIADLSLSKKLTDSLSAYKKEIKDTVDQAALDKEKLEYKVNLLTKNLHETQAKKKFWQMAQQKKIDDLRTKMENFHINKDKKIEDHKITLVNKLVGMQYDSDQLLKTLISQEEIDKRIAILNKREAECGSATCPECGSQTDSAKRMIIMKDSYALQEIIRINDQTKINIIRLEQQQQKLRETTADLIKSEQEKENIYFDLHAAAVIEKNPHSYKSILSDLSTAKLELQAATDNCKSGRSELTNINFLTSINEHFRQACIKNTIVNLQASTNKLLRDYFDAEITVEFTAEDADSLDVQIMKDGNKAAYTQLSKGQRGLLKLCFGVSVMQAVSNHNGIKFAAIFLDEFTDGLDESMNIKAYRLLESLSSDYESIFAISHSEGLKASFINKYEVTLIDGNSHLEKA